jgi:hypothetical protein
MAKLRSSILRELCKKKLSITLSNVSNNIHYESRPERIIPIAERFGVDPDDTLV